MIVTHLQSSTQIVEMGEIRVLTDPWLTEGEYYGSWYHYPPFAESELSLLQYDYIYVSHIHPDHLSEATLNKLPYKKPILIHKYSSPFLKRKLELLGFEVIELNNTTPYKFKNGSQLTIYAADNCNPELCSKFLGCGHIETKFGSTQIDSLALFSHGGKHLLNLNDCPYELASYTILKNGLDKLDIDLLMVGYAGAGPYPQCFQFDSIELKNSAAKAKQIQFLQQALNFIELVKPKAFAPFAGTYVLGSRYAHMNEHRGVPSLEDATCYLEANTPSNSKGLLLNQHDKYDLTIQQLIKSTKAVPTLKQYMNHITQQPLAYDNDVWDDNELEDLMLNSYLRFKTKADEINYSSPTYLVIESEKVCFTMSLDKKPTQIFKDSQVPQPYVRLTVEHNLLHRLLRGPKYAHWNNAEIGSHIQYERKPNTFERALYHCLCFFHQ